MPQTPTRRSAALKTLLLASAGLACAGPALAADGGKTVSEVVVTGAPYVVSLDSSTTNIDVLRRDDLDAAPAGGLGDVLAGLPGVRSSFFGPGASRPVIRGLAGPRVMVLTNGVGQIDASALSPDHQVATDPQEAERIEVLRGPSALAYGGSAIGGVVNVIDGRIPETPVDGVHGRALVAGSTVDEGRSASAALRAGANGWAVTLDGTTRRSEDYDVPAPPESDRLRAAEGEAPLSPRPGTVANTAVDLDAYGLGVSRVGERGFIGLSIKRTETTYGVPGHVHEGGAAHDHDHDHDHEHEEGGHDHAHEEGAVAIDLKQTRYDARGALEVDWGPFAKVRFAAGYADYEHVELENGEPATRFMSDGWEGRLELVQADRDGWQGAVGVQGLHRNFDAVGEEALVPPTKIDEAGVFTLQRLDRERWGVEGGLRVDRRELDSTVGERYFTNVSASVGGFWRPAAGWFLGLSGGRTSRAPTEDELFANGPHPATQSFELGDADLDQEISYSLDATAHYRAGPWSADLHAFVARYEGFIDLRPTGEADAESGLPIYAYRQTDARFHGAEAEVSYRLWRDGERSFTLEATADYVRGETDLGPPARIPPWSATGRGVFEGGWWTGVLELRQVGDQERVAESELPTDGYRMLNASLTVRPLKDRDFKVFVEGRNLGDAEAREHASFLKDLAPLPGRNVRVGVGYSF